MNKPLVTIRSDSMDTVVYENGYYTLGHFSKYVDPNAYRISSNTFNNDVENVAFLNPDNTISVIVSSRTTNNRIVRVQWKNKYFEAYLRGLSASTFKFSAV